MSESKLNLVEMPKLKPPESAEQRARKALRARIEPVLPTHIVDVWRMVEHSIRDGGQLYPDTTEDSADAIRSHLFTYLQAPNFAGLIARHGKRPVGLILGHVASRPYGRPSRYAFVWAFWVEPQLRGQGVGQQLWGEYQGKLKKAQIYHWEALANDSLARALVRESGIPVNRLLSVIGGRL